jgi:radical SAM protein with 4Fe4S-binding SPASM domain
LSLTKSLFYVKHAKTIKKKFSSLKWGLSIKDCYSPYPLEVKYEITRRCNLSCKMCMRKSLKTYEDVTEKQLIRVLNQLKNTAVFSPHGYGEALMHPNFLEFMKIVTEHKFAIRLVTNGLLLTPDVSKKFIKQCKPDSVRFSVDAGIDTVYEDIRRGARFEDLVSNIESIIDFKKRFSPKTIIGIYCTLGKYNIDQIEPLILLSKKLGVDQLSFVGLTQHNVGLATGDNTIRSISKETDAEAQINHYSRIHKLEIPITFSFGGSTCVLPFVHTFVQSNGDVFPCTDTLNYPLGNIYEQPFEEIWNGQRMKDFRKSYLKGKIQECNKCVLLHNKRLESASEPQ